MSTKRTPKDEALSRMREFRRALRVLEREAGLSLASQTECCGVTSAQCHILLELEASGGSSVGELAEALELAPSTMSRGVDALVKAGLVSRAEDESNRRRIVIALTQAGREKADYIDRACDEYYEGVLAEADEARRRALTEAVAYLAAAIRTARLSGGACCGAQGVGKEE
jgi:DNA-binding MarR family transcriptional regulator